MSSIHRDVLIIGAGLSGICSAYHLQEKCPKKSYVILESRANLGGTWDLFKYPGIRSDSDMTTLGFKFRPWTGKQLIADGPAIMNYITETARDAGILEKIVYHSRVERADWDSEQSLWKVSATDGQTGEQREYTCNFLHTCCGYYRYDKGFTPDFKGLDNYEGHFIHPQHWPEDLDYRGKSMIIIGSGATAVTLVPALVEGGAAKVTMLQRSPSYFLEVPREDTSMKTLGKFMSEERAYRLVRWRNIQLAKFLYGISRRYPNFMKKRLIKGVRKALPEGYDVDKHFTPKYAPWDQRLCMDPDGHFFKAIASGSAEVVTDHIKNFTAKGIALESGAELEADIVVSATGLNMQLIGGIKIFLDGEPVIPRQHVAYKSGIMVSEIPNLAAVSGYTNASWTLKADLAAEYVCRLLNYMDKHGHKVARAIYKGDEDLKPFMINFTAGYIQRAIDRFPSQGQEDPWLINQNYKRDIQLLLHEAINDGHLSFS